MSFRVEIISNPQKKKYTNNYLNSLKLNNGSQHVLPLTMENMKHPSKCLL